MYGAESLRQYIRHHVALAQYLADRVAEDARFEVAAPPRFGLVCFRLVPGGFSAWGLQELVIAVPPRFELVCFRWEQPIY